MKRALRIAVVGTGYFSRFHFNAWSRCDDVELVGIASLNTDKANELSGVYGGEVFSDVTEMCEEAKPDLLDVVVPPSEHQKIIEIAARFGIDVICQKPFCGDLETARAVTQSAQQSGIKLTVHENFRFQPWYQRIKAILDSDALGQVYQSTFNFRPGDGQGADAYLERQPYFRDMERFFLHETGIHFIDVFRFLFGEVDSVWADMSQLNPAIKGEDRCHIVMSHGNIRTILDGNRLSDHKAESRRLTMGELLIEGERGVLTLSGDGEIHVRAFGTNKSEPIPYTWNDHGFGGDCVYNFTRHVVDHYISGTPLMNPAFRYLVNLELEELAYESAKDGCRKLVRDRVRS